MNNVIAIGSNINPTHHVPLALDHLAQRYHTLVISRILETAPVGMQDGSSAFYNLCVAFEADVKAVDLKADLVGIEVALGRDRQNPNRSKLARPIDLDIVFQLPAATNTIQPGRIPPEDYIRAPLADVLAELGIAHDIQPTISSYVALRWHQLEIGLATHRVQWGAMPRLIA